MNQQANQSQNAFGAEVATSGARRVINALKAEGHVDLMVDDAVCVIDIDLWDSSAILWSEDDPDVEVPFQCEEELIEFLEDKEVIIL